MRKFMAILCFCLLLGLLASCGSNGDNGDDPATVVTDTDDQDDTTYDPVVEDDDDETPDVTEDDGEWDPLGRFAETVYVTQTRILTAWMGFDEGEDEDYNWWTRAYYDHLNVVLTNLFTADSWGEPFDMAMNLAFATGELPDVMPLYTSLAVRALEGGLIMDITDIFERYASQQVKDIYATDPTSLEAWTFDGRLMGLSNPAGLGDYPFFWVPTSMLYGYNGGVMPTTLDEITSLARWIRDYTGSYAIGLDDNLREMFYLLNVFGGTEHWIEQDGQLINGRIQEEVRQTLALLAQWYAEGLLAVDFAVRTDGDVEADFVNRRFGILIGSSHVPNGSRGRNFMLLHPDDDLVAIPMMRADGQPMVYTTSAGYNDAVMISARAENPEAIMRMFNLGTAVVNDAERPAWVTDVYWNTTPGGNMGWWNRMATGSGYVADVRYGYEGLSVALRYLRAGSDGTELRAANAFRTLENFDRVMDWLNYGTDAEHWEGNWAMWSMLLGSESSVVVMDMHAAGRIVPTPRWGAETSAEATHSANLAARFREFATVAIMNDDVDSQFDQWVQFFYDNGGDEINEQVNQWWAEHGR